MAARILQINFRLNVPPAEFEQIASSLASDFAKVPGLRWKIWLMNEASRAAGGIYLFEDKSSLNAFLESPLAEAVTFHPALSDVSAKPFEVIEDVTAIIRGPV